MTEMITPVRIGSSRPVAGLLNTRAPSLRFGFLVRTARGKRLLGRASVKLSAKKETLQELPSGFTDLSTGLLLSALISPETSLATETVSYDPSSGNDFLINAAGAGYVLLVAYFLFRILTRRAKRFREQKIADSPSLFGGSDLGKQNELPVISEKRLTAVDGLIGVLQSGLLTAGLFFFTIKLDAVILSTPLPEQYTAHNIAVTVRTIIRGFCYLFTFVFGMNFVGLSGLTIKLLIDPDSVNEEVVPPPVDNKPQLPKISVISDPEEVARAFDEVSKRSSTRDRS